MRYLVLLCCFITSVDTIMLSCSETRLQVLFSIVTSCQEKLWLTSCKRVLIICSFVHLFSDNMSSLLKDTYNFRSNSLFLKKGPNFHYIFLNSMRLSSKFEFYHRPIMYLQCVWFQAASSAGNSFSLSLFLFRKWSSMFIGMGKIMVELCSAAILLRV